jgi:hypothetical protein
LPRKWGDTAGGRYVGQKKRATSGRCLCCLRDRKWRYSCCKCNVFLCSGHVNRCVRIAWTRWWHCTHVSETLWLRMYKVNFKIKFQWVIPVLCIEEILINVRNFLSHENFRCIIVKTCSLEYVISQNTTNVTSFYCTTDGLMTKFLTPFLLTYSPRIYRHAISIWPHVWGRLHGKRAEWTDLY